MRSKIKPQINLLVLALNDKDNGGPFVDLIKDSTL